GPDAVWDLIPDFVENHGASDFHEVDDLLAFAELSDQMIMPLVDTRYLWGDVPTALQGYLQRGFKGIKGLYLPDNENDLGVRSIPDSFGITLEQYRQREWEIFSFVQNHDLPLLYHMDARRYGDAMMELLDDFPKVRVNFPHLGISRKAFSKILDRYPNVYTDIASLLPYIRSNPGSYRDFIMHYPDRVCFGSDAFLYQAERVIDYIDVVKELKLPEEIERQVFNNNPARFLGSALDNPV
ncbi:MAG: amidohydrolase family protein, partial [Desulfuromonadaceae bacterium]